ncbi:MAG: hydantoinase/oxoprolinase family protein, partial [Acidobacteriota bacterium]
MKVRIGIDVGGTFTDVVVIDQQTRELIGQLKLPTTHHAEEGVALGIVRALERALQDFAIAPDEVVFIAHSTTQATNALLEGDVARVAVLAGGEGLEGWLARRATRVPPIRLTPQRSLTARQVWLGKDLAPPRRWRPWREWQERQKRLRTLLEGLAADGVEVLVASNAFGVDQPDHETMLASEARLAGLLATSGHEVSSLYGLRVRTRTAVINAAILPKMIETAGMTERCVRETGIESPLMIMRSDGGVMSVGGVRRRPILTMLSGPAAGIAGALMHERISDGIFIEVGGTSADISVIRDGSPATRPARLNGHRMYLNTLDVRTLGVGGGSMIRVRADNDLTIVDVGPRSAHIAGLGYVCFTEPDRLDGATIEVIQPTERDECDHLVLRMRDGQRVALTTTCAANLLGLVAEDHFARGRADSAAIAFGLLAERQGQGSEEVARQVLELAGRKIAATIDDLIIEYQLARDQVVLVGGGGGAASLVPVTASLMGLEHRLARNAEVISPIGVAMAMVRDSIERNIVDPTPEEILAVRREATVAAINSGALPESIEVQVEVDKRRNLV